MVGKACGRAVVRNFRLLLGETIPKTAAIGEGSHSGESSEGADY